MGLSMSSTPYTPITIREYPAVHIGLSFVHVFYFSLLTDPSAVTGILAVT